MVSINLLPKDSAPSKNELRFASAINKIAMFSVAVFLLICVFGGGAYFILARQLQSANDDAQRLSTSVQSLQSSESSLILIRDRVQKAQAALNSRISEGYFDKHQKILSLDIPGISFVSSTVDSGKSVIELEISGSASMASLFSTLLADSQFSSLILEKLSYNSLTGYDVTLQVY